MKRQIDDIRNGDPVVVTYGRIEPVEQNAAMLTRWGEWALARNGWGRTIKTTACVVLNPARPIGRKAGRTINPGPFASISTKARNHSGSYSSASHVGGGIFIDPSSGWAMWIVSF